MNYEQKTSLALFFLILSFLNISHAQTSGLNKQDIGNPFIRWYNSKEYKAAASNWCILQDKRGIMYFGNETGLLEYDGLNWNKINIPHSVNVRALALDSSGIIYVCARSDIGYLKADSNGQLVFISLTSFLPLQERDFGEAWDVVATSNAVFFKTQNKIFRWDKKNFFIWDSIFAYRLYNINNTIYSRNEGTGLMMIDEDIIKLVPDGNFFASLGVYDMLPYNDNSHPDKKILITTNDKGLFLYDGKTFTTFKTEVDSFLKNNQIYNACITMYGNFAFATQRGGLIVMNSTGKLLKIINEKKGLLTNVIYDVYSSYQGSLWLATANGIALCEVPSPFSVIPNKELLNGLIYSIIKNDNKLYAANDMGIIYSEDKNNFSLVKGLNKPGVFLLNVDNDLFAGTNVGTGLIINNKIVKMFINNPTNIIVKSEIHKGRVYIGHRDGLTILEKNNNDYEILTTNISNEISNIIEEKNGALWLESFTEKIYYSPTPPQKNLSSNQYYINYRQIQNEDGLPGVARNLFNINGTMLMSTDKGIYYYNSFSREFILDKTLGKKLSGKSTFINMVAKSYNKSFWILSTTNGVSELGKAEYVNGNYYWRSNPRFNRLFLNSIYTIYSDYDSVNHHEQLWISNDEGLFVYNEDVNRNYKYPFKTLIRKVSINNDSLIYAGNVIPKVEGYDAILPFNENNVTFNVSAASTDKPDANLYQYYLKGNDNDWSPWTSETKKVYTNLSFGTYYFKVRAKNIYGIIGTEDVYSIRILAPWYLSWWALLIYTGLIISSVYFIDKLMRRRVVNIERTRARIRETELIKNQAYELETVDSLVKVINRAEDLDNLLNSLLQQTLGLIPQGDKASVLLYNKRENLFKVAFTIGYTKEELKDFYFTPEEIRKRYTDKSEELEKGIYLIKDTRNLYGDDKLPELKKSASMLVMEVNREDQKTEAYVVYDSFDEEKPFDHDSAGLLKRFHEHAVSAISKAQAMKTLKEKNEEILKSQEQLVSQQKLASLGALTAGIAHEIKNPLNFINNFSEVSEELFDDLLDELNKGNNDAVMDLIKDIKINLSTINHHGKRADSIIKGMLLHSRGSSGEKIPTDINELIDQYITLAYHGLKAQNKEFNINIEKYYDKAINKINIVPQDISRVILNIINNAYYAVNEKKLKTSSDYTPTIVIQTKNLADAVEIRIKDNGTGISEKAKSKLFSPFFTTKPSGEGTGLGLSISYDIITKQHSGEIRFESEADVCTEFMITLPK